MGLALHGEGFGQRASNSVLPPCSPAPSLFPRIVSFLGEKSPLVSPRYQGCCGFEAASCDFSQHPAHDISRLSTVSTLLLPEWVFFSAPAIQCLRIMDRFQPKEFNSAPAPFQIRACVSGVLLQQETITAYPTLGNFSIWRTGLDSAPWHILMESHSCAWHLEEKV